MIGGAPSGTVYEISEPPGVDIMPTVVVASTNLSERARM